MEDYKDRKELIFSILKPYTLAMSEKEQKDLEHNIHHSIGLPINESISHICKKLLKQKNVTAGTKRYLIGKRYTAAVSDKKKHKTNNEIASAIGADYKLSGASVQSYSLYAHAIDVLSDDNSALTTDILSGKAQISINDVIKVSKELDDKTAICPQIKNMPSYDPDADFSSLSLTIPSWINFLNKTNTSANFATASYKAKLKLLEELNSLINAANNILTHMEET